MQGHYTEGIEESEALKTVKIDAIFVSDKRMLSLRRNTENIPVGYLAENDKLTTFEGYDKDMDIIENSLIGIINYNKTKEVFDRIINAIEEKTK